MAEIDWKAWLEEKTKLAGSLRGYIKDIDAGMFGDMSGPAATAKMRADYQHTLDSLEAHIANVKARYLKS